MQFTGKSAEEAVKKGLEELSLTIEDVDIVVLEESIAHTPVGVAVLYLIGETVVVMREFVEGDMDGLPVEVGHGRGEPVVARHHLQCGDLVAEYLMALGPSGELSHRHHQDEE